MDNHNLKILEKNKYKNKNILQNTEMVFPCKMSKKKDMKSLRPNYRYLMISEQKGKGNK